jgi:hypothetical protein
LRLWLLERCAEHNGQTLEVKGSRLFQRDFATVAAFPAFGECFSDVAGAWQAAALN